MTRATDVTVRPWHPRHGTLPDWATTPPTTASDTPEEANNDDVAS